MPDISMCMNKECPLKDTCWRFIAPANELRQAYCDFWYKTNAAGVIYCENYWKAATLTVPLPLHKQRTKKEGDPVGKGEC